MNRYPREFNEILSALETAGANKKIKSGDHKSYWGIDSWWTYVDGIELPKRVVDYYNNEGEGIFREKMPHSLKSLISKSCNGKIEHSIIAIKEITKDALSLPTGTIDCKSIEHLRLMEIFLREILTIINRHKVRPGKYTDKEVSHSNIPQEIEKNDAEIDPVRRIAYDLRNHSNVIRVRYDSRPTGPRSPNFFMSGFCLVCHMAINRYNYYCHAHSRSEGTDADIKASRRMINAAFSNLEMKMDFEWSINTTGLSVKEMVEAKNAKQKEFGISNESAFIERCYKLEGWANHRPEHNLFKDKIYSLLKIHSFHYSDPEWKNAHIETFNKIIEQIKKIPHLEKTFHGSFSCGKNLTELQSNLSTQVFKISVDADVKFTPPLSIAMLDRMSIINLIKLASNKRSNIFT